MAAELTVYQEHQLKKQLLKLQIAKELDALNDKYALRKFGYPFLNESPKTHTSPQKKSRSLRSDSLKVSYRTSKLISSQESLLSNASTTSFPILSFFLQEFVMNFPLFSTDPILVQKFWQNKFQSFYENFISLKFENSKLSKSSTPHPNAFQTLVQNVLLYIFNKGIPSLNNQDYYTQSKLSAGIKTKTYDFKNVLKNYADTIKFLSTESSVFINSWDINIVSVVDASLIVSQNATPNKKSSSSSKAAASKWMKNTFGISTPSSSSLLSMLSISDSGSSKASSKLDHVFLLKVLKEGDTLPTYVIKSYEDFKELAVSLKEKFPSKKMPILPHKHKDPISASSSTDSLIARSSASESKFRDKEKSWFWKHSSPSLTSLKSEYSAIEDAMPDSNALVPDEVSYDEFQDNNVADSSPLPHENIRTALRQYLRKLAADKEVAVNDLFTEFLDTKKVDVSIIQQPLVAKDIASRTILDRNRLSDECADQREEEETMKRHFASMDEFMTSLFYDDNYMRDLIDEVKDNDSVEGLSPIFKDFIGLVKRFLAVAIHDMFLGNENSYSLFFQARRLQKLMPYAMMAQIMKLPNSMAIVKGIIDLFLSQPFGGYSLLQTMFATVLTEDLKVQNKIIKKLEKNIAARASGSIHIINCLKDFAYKTNDGDAITMQDVQNEAASMNMPVTLIVLMKGSQNSKISQDDLDDIIESYNIWKENEASGAATVEEGGLYFEYVKELFRLYIKRYDKKLTRRMWQEPELTQVLKSVVSLIYDHMVKVFKVAKADVALKNFEKFTTDLIKLIDGIIDGQYGTCTRFDKIRMIQGLIDNHQAAFYALAHDFCRNDTEGIIEMYVAWAQHLIQFVKRSQSAGSSNIDFSGLFEEPTINAETVLSQLNGIIQRKGEKKEKTRECLNKLTKASTELSSLRDTVSNAAIILECAHIVPSARDMPKEDLEVARSAFFEDALKDILNLNMI